MRLEDFERERDNAYYDQICDWARSERGIPYPTYPLFPELHAQFVAAPVLPGDTLLERFPDVGWRFRAELDGDTAAEDA